MIKKCSKCNKWKEDLEFGTRPEGNKVRSWCKVCEKIILFDNYLKSEVF